MKSVDGKGGGSELVVTELSHIKELVAQLEVHLGGSPDLCKHLASEIFSLTERSIGIITSSNLHGGRGLALATPSSLSESVNTPFKITKKRKMMEKRRHQVRVCSAGSGENPVDDGHSWRKYGQKEILGARHPRGYYRCTHRHSQGCAATKQVQRSDEDRTLFDVIYHGNHTCVQTAAAATQPQECNPDFHNLLRSLSSTLEAKTEGLGAATEPQDLMPFCFYSTPASGYLEPERSPFSAPTTSENWGVSPGTSDSNNNVVSFQPLEAAARDAVWGAQSEFQEMVSALVAATSAPSPAPALDMDFSDELSDLDTTFDVACLFA